MQKDLIFASDKMTTRKQPPESKFSTIRWTETLAPPSSLVWMDVNRLIIVAYLKTMYESSNMSSLLYCDVATATDEYPNL